MTERNPALEQSTVEVLSSATDGALEIDDLRGVAQATADVATVAQTRPAAVTPVIDDCVALALRTLDDSSSTAERMFGRRDLLLDTRRNVASLLASLAAADATALAAVTGDAFDLALRDPDDDCRASFETVVGHLATGLDAEIDDALTDVCATLTDDTTSTGARRRAAEVLRWVAEADVTAVAPAVGTLLEILDSRRVGQAEATGVEADVVAVEALRSLAAVVRHRELDLETSEGVDVGVGADAVAVPSAGPFLRSDDDAVQAAAAAVLSAVADTSPTRVTPYVPDLFGALSTPPARDDAEAALRVIGRDTPDAIASELDELRAVLANGGPQDRVAAARVAKAAGGGGVDPGGDPSVLVDVIPELTDALVTCPPAREPAGWALGAVGEAHPDAMVEVLPRLQRALTTSPADTDAGGNAALLKRVTDVVRKTAAGDPTVVEELAPTLVDVLLTSERARSDARWALERIAAVRPHVVADARPKLTRGLRSDDPALRELTAEVFVEAAEADPAAVVEAVPVLADALVTSPGAAEDIKWALVPVAETVPDAVGEVLPRLADGLEADDPAVRAAAAGVVRALADGDPTAASAVVSTLVDLLSSCAAARFDAAWALERVGAADPDSVAKELSCLRGALVDDRPAVRERAASVLAATADADPMAVSPAVPELVATLREYPSAREDVMGALEAVGRGAPDAIQAELSRLVTTLRDAGEDGKTAAAVVLAATAEGSPEVVVDATPALLDALIDGEPPKRREFAAAALDRVAVARPDAVVEEHDALSRGLTATDADVRARTAGLTRRTAEATATPASLAPLADGLETALEAERFETRRDAATALAVIARNTSLNLSEARSTLQRLAAHHEASVTLKTTIVDLLSTTEGTVTTAIDAEEGTD